MSKYTPSPPYTEQEFADMIQCYLDSGKKIELTQMYYLNRYPSRRKPKLYTLEKVVQKYLKTLASTSAGDVDEEVPNSASEKDNRIITYFKNNTHASIKKAASIFNVQSTYIEKLLEEKKAEITKSKKNKHDEIDKDMSLGGFLKGQKKNIKCAQIEVKKEDWEELQDEEEMNVNEDKEIEEQTPNIKVEVEEPASEHFITDELNIKFEPVEREECSKTFKSQETVDDAVPSETLINETITTKKRKIKLEMSDDYKKLKTSATYTSPNNSKISPMYNAIVYTTRLEEMNILHEKIKNLNSAYVKNEILRESKPKFNGFSHRSNSKVRKTMSFKLLKTLLKQLNKINNLIDLTDDNPVEVSANNSLEMNVQDLNIDISKKADTYNVEEANVKELVPNENVVIIINNLNLKLRDVYVTDSKGTIVEYYCVKWENAIIDFLDPFKNRLILDTCCWFHRQLKTELLWPPHEYSFSRFLTTTHKCTPGQCKCCCRPKEVEITTTKYKVNEVNVFEHTKFDENKSLMSKALTYKKAAPNTKEKSCELLEYKNSTTKRVVFSETGDLEDAPISRKQYFEFGKTQDVLFYADLSPSPVKHCTVNKVRNFGNVMLCSISDYFHMYPSYNLNVCCKWRRDSFLLLEYRARNMSANTLRFLKKTIFPIKCEMCKEKEVCKGNERPKLVVNMPPIEHTRSLTKSSLLKFGCIGKKSHKEFETQQKITPQNTQFIETTAMVEKSTVDQLVTTCKEIPAKPQQKVTPQMSHFTETTAMVEKSTVDQLVITCKEIPGIEFTVTDVDHEIATAIVTKVTVMRFSVKEDGKVVASLNLPMQTTSTEEFQILAQILQNIQYSLKFGNLAPGSVINLVAKIKVDNNTVIESTAFTTATKDIDRTTSNKLITNNTTTTQSGTNTIKSKDQLCGEENESNPNMKVNKMEVGTDRDSILKNMLTKNNPKIFTDNFFTELRTDESFERRNKSYDCFAQLVSRNKKCYAGSFNSYLRAKKDYNNVKNTMTPTMTPKISNVYSLQSSNIDPSFLPSTSETADVAEVTETIATCNDNIDILNSTDSSTSLAEPSDQEIILFDPETQQIVRLVPNAVDANILEKIYDDNENVASMNQIKLHGDNDTIAVLTPINEINSSNVTYLPVSLSDQVDVIQDIINGIPENNNVKDENDEVVKEEIDVVVLDSD